MTDNYEFLVTWLVAALSLDDLETAAVLFCAN
jgi:hypothetical protein